MSENFPGGGADVPERRIDRAADSAIAKIGARIVTPVLLMVTITLLGFIGNSVIESNKEVALKQDAQGKDIDQIKSDVRNVNTRLDERVIRQVETNTDDIRNLKDRVETIERVVRTP